MKLEVEAKTAITTAASIKYKTKENFKFRLEMNERTLESKLSIFVLRRPPVTLAHM